MSSNGRMTKPMRVYSVNVDTNNKDNGLCSGHFSDMHEIFETNEYSTEGIVWD